MRKIVAMTLAGASLAAVPALAQARISATQGFLHIGGASRLAATSTLRVPIRCAIDCDTTAYTKLTTPGDEVGPDKVTGHLSAGKVKKLIVTLNDNATADIKEHPNSRLKVKVLGVGSGGGPQVKAVKVFRFKAS